jgi:exosortase family protein XrtM
MAASKNRRKLRGARRRTPQPRKPPTPALAEETTRSRSAVRYVAKVAAIMAVLYGAYYYTYPDDSLPARAIHALLVWQAKLCGFLIWPFDHSVHVAETTIDGRFAIQVVKDCSSLDVQALVTAAVLAFPAAWRQKLAGVLFGLSAVMAANLVRIAGLYFIGAYLPKRFDSIHEELMPLMLVFVACAAFAGWARWVSRAAVAA